PTTPRTKTCPWRPWQGEWMGHPRPQAINENALRFAAELDDAAAVALGGAMLGQGRKLLHGLAFGGCLEARGDARLGLAVEGLSHRRRAAHLAEGEDLDLKDATFVFHFKLVADV